MSSLNKQRMEALLSYWKQQRGKGQIWDTALSTCVRLLMTLNILKGWAYVSIPAMFLQRGTICERKMTITGRLINLTKLSDWIDCLRSISTMRNRSTAAGSIATNTSAKATLG